MKEKKEAAYGTFVLAAVNVIIYLLLSFGGSTEDVGYMLDHGAMYVPYILDEGMYGCLLTSMFLHFGFRHLVNNMFMLLVVGSNLEPEMGTVRFLITYMVSGLAGNLVSGFLDYCTGDYVVSAGASGAIFGLIGALLFVVLRNRGRVRNISARGMVIMAVLSLYFGFASTGVDNAAHVGGLMSGFLMAVRLYRKKNGEYGRTI